MEFYFDIKARVDNEGDSFSKWGWPPVWSGRVEAKDSKHARLKVEEEYNRKFIMKDGKNTEKEMFLLSLKPMSEYLAKRFDLVECAICGEAFTANEAYILGMRDARFCSLNCKAEDEQNKELKRLNESIELGNFINPPVIYQIRNIKEDKVYIGKSIRSFTLRWWEHLKIAKSYSKATNKFHSALQNSELADWEFKVIEVIKYPDNISGRSEMERYILQRETYWMNKLNSINNGYNSVESFKTRTYMICPSCNTYCSGSYCKL